MQAFGDEKPRVPGIPVEFPVPPPGERSSGKIYSSKERGDDKKRECQGKGGKRLNMIQKTFL
jgi:hypothetical protein